MDTESVISIDGMEVMANPETHITERQLEQIRYEKEREEERRKQKEERRKKHEARKQQRVEQATSLTGFELDPEVESVREEFKKKLVISPTVPRPEPTTDPVLDVQARLDLLKSQMASLAENTDPLADFSGPKGTDLAQDDAAAMTSEEALNIFAPSFQKSKISPKMEVDEMVDEKRDRGNWDRSRNYETDTDVDKDRDTSSDRHRVRGRTSWERREREDHRYDSRYDSSPRFRRPEFKREFDKYMEDDVDFRIKDMAKIGIKPSDGFDLEVADKRRKEMEHWRMKLSLDEKELAENCSTFIAVGADLLEGLCDAINFHAFETKDLSKEMEKAIKDGRFNSCIRQYANMGGNQFMKNPLMNFLTTFCSIALKNHLSQKKNHILGSKHSSKRKRRTINKSKSSAPSYVRESKSASESELSATTESDGDFSDRRKRSRGSRRHKYVDYNHYPRYPFPPPQMYPYWGPYYSGPPHVTPPFPHNSQPNHEAPSFYNAQHHNRHTEETSHTTDPQNVETRRSPRNNIRDNMENVDKMSKKKSVKTKKSPAVKVEPLPVSPVQSERKRSIDSNVKSQPVHNHHASASEKKRVTDRKTGKSRILMDEVTQTLPIEKLSSTMSKFTPVLKRVKQNMETTKKYQTAREELGEASKPKDLFG